jgi:hypothetical protein
LQRRIDRPDEMRPGLQGANRGAPDDRQSQKGGPPPEH